MTKMDYKNKNMNTVYLLLGSNMGDSEKYLQLATNAIENGIGTVIKQSHIYKTAAWGLQNQPDFLNKICIVETTKRPKTILNKIQLIENKLDRIRIEKYGQRTIDIDILFYNYAIVNQPNLTIPHPQIQNRRFVLISLQDVSENYQHPILLKTATELLQTCSDSLNVQKIL